MYAEIYEYMHYVTLYEMLSMVPKRCKYNIICNKTSYLLNVFIIYLRFVNQLIFG